jgi:hypothetical protein
VTSGARGTLTWEETAQKFCRAVAPCAEGRRPASSCSSSRAALFADLYFTVARRRALAEQAGVGVVIDVFALDRARSCASRSNGR